MPHQPHEEAALLRIVEGDRDRLREVTAAPAVRARGSCVSVQLCRLNRGGESVSAFSQKPRLVAHAGVEREADLAPDACAGRRGEREESA